VGKILALDYGRRRIGIALSDRLHLTAQPYATWEAKDQAFFFQRLKLLIEQESVERIVVGLPITLRGEKGMMANQLEAFVKALTQVVSVPVVTWDERFTTQQAHRALHEMGKKPSRHKALVDTVSAVFLLQSYLEYLHLHQGESL